MKVLLREHDHWTKHYVFDTDSGEATTLKPRRRRVSKISGFAHRCRGGLVSATFESRAETTAEDRATGFWCQSA